MTKEGQRTAEEDEVQGYVAPYPAIRHFIPASRYYLSRPSVTQDMMPNRACCADI